MRFLVSLLLLCAATAVAQSYPTRPVRVLVGFPPGGKPTSIRTGRFG